MQPQIELKCRNKHYDDLIIEKDKWERMMKIPNRVRYVCQTPQGYWSFNIKKLPEPQWTKRFLPRTTFWDADDREKEVGYYNIKLGKKLQINITNIN